MEDTAVITVPAERAREPARLPTPQREVSRCESKCHARHQTARRRGTPLRRAAAAQRQRVAVRRARGSAGSAHNALTAAVAAQVLAAAAAAAAAATRLPKHLCLRAAHLRLEVGHVREEHARAAVGARAYRHRRLCRRRKGIERTSCLVGAEPSCKPHHQTAHVKCRRSRLERAWYRMAVPPQQLAPSLALDGALSIDAKARTQ
eukprot:1274903-Pleurochrysis_carterae.AAC.2